MLDIVKVPHPILRKKAQDVTSFDDNLKNLAEDMAAAMFASNGIGLASPQVNRSVRMMIIALGKNKYQAYVNPEIVDHSSSTKVGEEGCLSIPNVFGNVERFKKIKVKYQDLDGRWKTESASGLTSVVIQHEIDHLDGILFIDKTDDIVQGRELLVNI